MTQTWGQDAARGAIYFGDEQISAQDSFARVCAMGRALPSLGVVRTFGIENFGGRIFEVTINQRARPK